MSKQYLITVVTTQDVEGEREVIEMTTQATLGGEPDDYSLSYIDDDGESKDCRTTLRVQNGNCITIRREGDVDTHMIVEKNVRHISHHNTPYGSFALGICANKVDSKIKNDGGSLNFRYTTDIDMTPIGEIEFNITLGKQICN